MAQPPGTPEPTGPFSAGPSEMPPVVPGQSFEVRTAFTNRSPRSVRAVGLSLEAAGNWKFDRMPTPVGDASPNAPVVHTFSVAVPDDAELTRPYFSRQSIQDTRYPYVSIRPTVPTPRMRSTRPSDTRSMVCRTSSAVP